VTFKRIAVSPLETRIYVQTVGKPVNMPYLAALTVDGYTSRLGHAIADVCSFRSLPAEHGAATLTLSWPNSVVTAATGQRPTSGP
jgi:hypothetical protein